MWNLVRKVVLAGIGIVSLSRENAQKMMDDLAKKGKANKAPEAVYIMDLLEKVDGWTKGVRTKVDEFSNNIEEGFKSAINRVKSFGTEGAGTAKSKV